MEEDKNIIDKKKLYDDCYYPLEHYIEHKQIINKTDLFDAFSTDIIARYIHYRSTQTQSLPQPQPQSLPQPQTTDLRIGYILYMEVDTSINIKNKMNKLLNYMVQLKNPNIYVKSYWVIDETCSGINKIKVKVIVLENNKDYAIKMLINELIYNIKKKDKKYNKYLEKIDTLQ